MFAWDEYFVVVQVEPVEWSQQEAIVVWWVKNLNWVV